MPEDTYNYQTEHVMHNNIRLKIGITIFFVLLFSFFYFMRNTWSDNSRTRVALALSIIEDGTVNINKYHNITKDKALYDGNYYADKAPGYSFTALPAIWIGYKIFTAFCKDMGFSKSKIKHFKTACNNNNLTYIFMPYKQTGVNSHIKGVPREAAGTHALDFIQLLGIYFASGLISALTALILYFFAIKIGASTGGGVFASLTYGLATPAWVWSTSFHGHVLTGSCLFIAFAALYYLNNLREPSRRKEITLAFIVGALLSWAVVVEYPAAIASVIIALYGLSKVGKWERGKTVRTLLAASVAAVIFILPLLIYNYAAFDSPLSTGYQYVTNVGIFTGMDEGFRGLTYPRLERLYGILFGGARGLFWFSPILLLTPFAIYRYWRAPNSRGEVITICAVALYYLIWNSSYFYWHGGHATGPRHLVPILPFICLPLALLWTRAGAFLRWGLLLLFIASFSISLISASVQLQNQPEGINMILRSLMPRFFDGDISQVILSKPYIEIMNIGGPTMLLTLIPLFLVLLLGGLYIRKLLRQEKLSGS